MPSLLSLPFTIARVAVRLPFQVAEAGLERLRGGQEDEDDRPDGAEAPRPAAAKPKPAPRTQAQARRTQKPTKPRAAASPASASPASAPPAPGRAHAAAASAVPQASPAQAEPQPASPVSVVPDEPDHVDRDAVEVMSLGPADDPGPEIDIDPAVRRLGSQGSDA
jgi:hypothetical protein